MDFIEYTNAWAKSEVYQAKTMIGVGIFLAIYFIAIFSSENILLKGSLIPLDLLLAILLGYESFIIYSRPAHAKEIIGCTKNLRRKLLTRNSKQENDNKAGKLLIRIYPILMLVSVIALLFVSTNYYKGMALGFVLFFVATFIIDNGFVARSDAFFSFLKQ